MATGRRAKVCLLVGTYKGAFLFSSDLDRKKWELHGPFLKGLEINHIVLDTRAEPVVHACANSSWFGSTFRSSNDFGATWRESDPGILFSEGSEKKVARLWYIKPGRAFEPNVLYVGVDPGALFKSADGGNSWLEVESLSNHATREQWQPGAGGLMVHSICLDPVDRKKISVGISAAGTFATEDEGQSWQPRNTGVLADFLPDKYPEVGQCVHHMEAHNDKPDLLYQQNHCGVYRSENGGKEWTDISEGLPSRFGFPLKIHSHDPKTIYVIPEEGPDFRCPVNGEFAVYRSRNGGNSWDKLNRGLPSRNAYLNFYRHSMAVDDCDPCGIYAGSSTGQIFYSRDEGNTWEVLANWLAPIYSLECAVV